MRKEHKDLIAFREMLHRIGSANGDSINPQRNAEIHIDRNIFGGAVDIPFFTGLFYEEIYCAFFGGEKPTTGRFRGVQPDVINGYGVGDVKACSVRKDLPFRPDQLAGYLEAGASLDMPSFYAFFFHNGNDGRNSTKDPEERMVGLASKTLGSLIIPGSLAVDLCRAALDVDNHLVRYSSKNERGVWVYLTTVGVRELFENPLCFISRIGGKSDGYFFERYTAKGIRVNGVPMVSFPVLALRDAYRKEHLSVPPDLVRSNSLEKQMDLLPGLFDDF